MTVSILDPESVDVSPLAVRVTMLALLTDEGEFRRWWDVCRPILTIDEHYAEVVARVDAYVAVHGRPPSVDTLVDSIENDGELPTVRRSVLLKVILDVLGAPVDDWHHHRDNVAANVRRRSFRAALDRAEELLAAGDYSAIVRSFQEASDVATKRDLGTVGFFSPGAVEARFERRVDPEVVRKRIALQIGALDKHLHGGVAPKTLSVFVGGTGRGKSLALVHVGRMAVLQGQRVLHLTLEMTSDEIVDMYDCAFTGTKREEVGSSAGKIRSEFLARFSGYGDSLRIVERPQYSLSPEDLSSLVLSFARDGYPVDVLILDYADLMTGGRRFSKAESRRHELNFIYTWLQRIAKENGAIVVTGTQTNRGGLDRKKRVDLTDISEDISKAWIADHVFCINQNEEEKDANRCRIFLAKNRSGVANVEVAFVQDPSRATFAIPSPFSSSRTVPAAEREGGSEG